MVRVTAMAGLHSLRTEPINDECQKLFRRMNPPRVVVDNNACEGATLVKVDSAKKHGLLLEVVQILTDMELDIRKAYISSDGGWFMDVFHVTDFAGNKVRNEERMSQIQKRIVDGVGEQVPAMRVHYAAEHTAIELTGSDRPGLMSEVFALLTHMSFNIVAAELWTHNMCVACLVCVTDPATGGPVRDLGRLHSLKHSLSRLLSVDSHDATAATDVTAPSYSVTHTERRLHQMMFADRDYERARGDDACGPTRITVDNCDDRGYSVINVECRNRPKLLFDTVCTLTDMEYVVFHAIIDSDGGKAYQEYYIRHADGRTLNSAAERTRVMQCLRAAIERRVSEGVRLELCTKDRVGLLSDVTRIFREQGLWVARAEVCTKGTMASNVFYLTGVGGQAMVEGKALEAVRREIGQAVRVSAAHHPSCSLTTSTITSSPPRGAGFLSSFLGRPSQVLLHHLGLIKS